MSAPSLADKSYFRQKSEHSDIWNDLLCQHIQELQTFKNCVLAHSA